jgi:hypothetical protein
VISRIPQGSVLGPIQFVLYINDLPSSVDLGGCRIVDETKIFRIIDNIRDPEILQDDLKQLEKWSENWLLKFHPEKCKHIHMQRKKEPNVRKYKLLGKPKTINSLICVIFPKGGR